MTTKRYSEFTRSELAGERREVFDAIAAPRGGQVPAPFHVLLESPELAAHTQALGAFCRYRSGFEPKHSEMIVLIVAAHWDAEYEFHIEIIAAIRAKETPEFDDPEAKLIHEFAVTYFARNDVPDALFEAAVANFGRRRVVELAGILGYYAGLAMLLRIFRVTPP